MYSLLASLSPVTHGSNRRQPISIKVKVFRRVQGYGKFFNATVDFILVDFILVDEKGTKIHAAANEHAFERFRGLEEGAWAEITGVVVSSWRDWNHLMALHHYCLVLPSDATVTPIPALSDYHFFNFTDFEDVISGYFNIAHPIDLLGTIHSVGKLSPPKNSADAARSIPFTLRNERELELYCIAYGRVAEEFSYQWSLHDGTPVRCLLSEWRVSQSRKVHCTRVENMIVDGGKYCRFWFNPEVLAREAEVAISEVADSCANSTT